MPVNITALYTLNLSNKPKYSFEILTLTIAPANIKIRERIAKKHKILYFLFKEPTAININDKIESITIETVII